MHLEEMQEILTQIKYPGYELFVKQLDSEHPYLQARYQEEDVDTKILEWQYTRKWQLSIHMCKSEIVQTAFKCIMTSMEHVVREHFEYKGQRIFGPHYDVDALHELCLQKKTEHRQDNNFPPR